MDDQDGALGRAYLDPSAWPFDAHLPLLAFAQHHGIPTRLLDWSQRALVAAYFAAAEAVVVGGSEPLAVWALNIEMVHLYPQVKVVRMPGANSARLGAQRGLFTVVRNGDRRGGPVSDGDFVEALVSANEDASKPRPLWKLTLPQSEARRLLYLCHLSGVDAAALFPGPEGAALAVLDRAAWSKANPATGLSATSGAFVPTIRSQRVR
jgi:hypothetical protein